MVSAIALKISKRIFNHKPCLSPLRLTCQIPGRKRKPDHALLSPKPWSSETTRINVIFCHSWMRFCFQHLSTTEKTVRNTSESARRRGRTLRMDSLRLSSALRGSARTGSQHRAVCMPLGCGARAGLSWTRYSWDIVGIPWGWDDGI